MEEASHGLRGRDEGVEDVGERERAATLTAAVAASWGREGSLPAVLKECVDAMVAHLDAAVARVWTLNSEKKVLELQAAAGGSIRLDEPQAPVPVGGFGIGLIAGRREPHLTNSLVGDPWVSDQEWARREGMASFAGFPLVARGRLQGVLEIFARHPLGPVTLEALALLARTIALGISHERAGEALRESEARFRSLFENAVLGLYRTTPDGRILLANPALVRMLGYASLEEMQRRNLESEGFEPGYSRTLFKERLEREAQIIGLESAWMKSDGTELWVRENARIVRGTVGEALCYEGTVEDVSDRKSAEEALRKSEELHRVLFEQARDMVLLLEVPPDGMPVIREVNEEAARALGYTRDELAGRPISFLSGEAFPEPLIERRRRVLEETGRASFRSRHRRKDGSTFDVEASTAEVMLGGKRIALSIERDITERLRGEELRAQLEGQIRLGQKLEALGTLAGGVAHDFNNILGTIIGNAELAKEDVGASRIAIESLDEIRKASRRARDLVQRILAFGSSRQEPRTVVSLRPAVEEGLAVARAALPAGIEIVARLDVDAPRVLAEPAEVVQALINLLTNAWHAMEGRPGQIELRLDSVWLDEETARADADLRPGHFARLSVTDTGTGIEASVIQRVFDPFFTTKPVGQGTGLGLSVVHGIMRTHGGAVTVLSMPGSGSTFSLYFPAAQAPETAVAPEKPASGARPVGGGRHVLYLDDEEALVFLASRLLGRRGYRVSGFTRAEEALAAMREDPRQFDLVVTDFNMPGMSGLDVALEISRLRPDLPVVLASGYITDDLRARALEAGVRHLVYKPNTVEELCDVVSRLALG